MKRSRTIEIPETINDIPDKGTSEPIRTLYARIPDSLDKRLRTASTNKGISINALTIMALEAFLK